jgi:FtsP/CotA-like multicopper oxidase with cupredoxin domain
MSRQQRIALVVAALVVAVAAFIVLRPSDDNNDNNASSTTPAQTAAGSSNTTPSAKPRPRSVRARIYAGKPAGGIQKLTVKKGDAVVVNVTSPNTSDEVHVHGYDLHGDLAPHKPVKIAFNAKIEGIFEIELEGSKTQIAELKVEP